MREELIFKRSNDGKIGVQFPKPIKSDLKIKDLLDTKFISDKLPDLPQLTEVDVIRHFIRLSTMNYCVDTNMYPLGSCTMKYNPKINEAIANGPGFSNLHPYQPETTVQGLLKIMYLLQEYLKDISGMEAVSLSPAAGAHGELTGMLIMAKYFENQKNRNIILIPDSAHGTNPSSASLINFKTIEIKSDTRGNIALDDLKKKINENIAGIMLTIPNTLGLFDENIIEITELVHKAGGLVYMDGANLNALLGIIKPSLLGVDIIHFNLHKTFSTPHGGGGPGSGPVGVKGELANYLPVPVVNKNEDKYFLDYDIKNTIGKVKEFYGNIGVCIKALAYIIAVGNQGLKKIAEVSVLNANYLRKKLERYYKIGYDRICMHECVFSNDYQKGYNIRTLDIAKALLDQGFYAPTVYFPLIVPEAIMIEPTETESLSELDRFIDTMIEIAKKSKENPEQIINSPYNTPVKRLDEVKAARELNLRDE